MSKVYATNRLAFFGFRPLEGDGAFVPDCSPFCLKLLAYLVVSDTDFSYSSIVNGTKRPPKPNGLIPFVALKDSGELMGDSQLIIEHLEGSREQASRLDGHLTPSQTATSHLIRRTVEESMYWTVGSEYRWFDAQLCKQITGPKYLDGLGLGCLVGMAIGHGRKGFVKRAKGQGVGLKSKAQRAAMGREDMQALEDTLASLGEGPFVHGEKVSSIDCVVYAMAANALFTAASYPCEAEGVEAKLRSGAFPRVLAHYKHFEDKFGPRLKEITTSSPQ